MISHEDIDDLISMTLDDGPFDPATIHCLFGRKGMAEAQIQSKIILALRELDGCMPIKIVMANLRGIPDLIVLFRGIVIGAEIKRPGQEPTKLQEARLQQMRDAGAITCVWHSVEEAMETMVEVGMKL